MGEQKCRAGAPNRQVCLLGTACRLGVARRADTLHKSLPIAHRKGNKATGVYNTGRGCVAHSITCVSVCECVCAQRDCVCVCVRRTVIIVAPDEDGNSKIAVCIIAKSF